MSKLIIDRTAKITINYTANDWELFDHMQGSEAAAVKLNECLADCINECKYNRANTEQSMEVLMDNLSGFGASDTEPRWQLRNILDKVYK